MRIVAGEWRGRTIAAPRGQTTRPTTDRVREALFNALAARAGASLGGGEVLDPFAGSGALGLEALSRGASKVTFVEFDRAALAALRSNVSALDATRRSTIVVGDAFSLAGGLRGGPFALILLDPPYTLDLSRIGELLAQLAATGRVQEGALVTWEHAAGTSAPWPDGYEPVSSKKYGSTEIEIATYERGEDGR